MNGQGRQVDLRIPITPMVKKIMLALTGVYLVSVLLVELATSTWAAAEPWLYLVHDLPFSQGRVWQWLTYGAFHELGPRPLISLLICAAAAYVVVIMYRSQWAKREFFLFIIGVFALMMLIGGIGFGAPFHLAGNIIVLYFFGHTFESRWGGRRFLTFWLVCTAAGGLMSSLAWYALPTLVGPAVVGASAGSMGLIAAFSIYFADQNVFYGLIVPIKAKYFLVVALVFDLVSLATGSNVAVFAHLGGVIAAALLTTGYWRPAKIAGKLRGGPKKKKRPNHLRLVPPPDDDDDDDKPPRYLH